MKRFHYFGLLIVISGLAACGGRTGATDAGPAEPENAIVQLQAEVMAIHDDVMPKTGQINQLSRQLRAYLEQHSELNEATRSTINETVTALEQAEEAMMDWMASYGGLTRQMEQMKTEEIVKTLETEKQNISEVREQMLSSIAAGEQLLAEFGKAEDRQN